MSDRQLLAYLPRGSRLLAPLFVLFLAAIGGSLFFQPESGDAQGVPSTGMVSVKVTNLTNGIYFTPLLVSAHDGATHLFQPGQAASLGLQKMAEGGNIADLLASLGGADADTIDNPASGLLAPGGSTTAMLDTSGTGNTHLSIVAMLLPTNDGFVGLDGLELPTEQGTYVYYIHAYDAGTEANDEIIVPGAGAPGQAGIPADPGSTAGSGATGVAVADDNTTIHIHRGVIGDSNPTGGASDLDPSVHRWLNPIARVVITVN